MAEAAGITMWVVRHGKTILDVRLAVKVTDGNKKTAVYIFDRTSSAKRQARANRAMDASAHLNKSSDKVRVLGKSASQSHPFTIPSQTKHHKAVKLDATDLASGDEAGSDATIRIGKRDGNGHFTVHLIIERKPGVRVSMEVPFDGDCGADLNNATYNGTAWFVTDGSQGAAQFELDTINAVIDSSVADDIPDDE